MRIELNHNWYADEPFQVDDDIKQFDVSNRPYPIYRQTIFTRQECDELYLSVIKDYDSKTDARVYTPDGLGSTVNRDFRDTDSYQQHLYLTQQHHQKLYQGVQNAANWFNTTLLTQSDVSQILGYGRGNKFSHHCDNSITDSTGVKWVCNDKARELTAICYISDQVTEDPKFNEFSGGSLIFSRVRNKHTNEPLVYRPRAGELVVFPSNPFYGHEVLNIRSGYRINIVSWWRNV